MKKPGQQPGLFPTYGLRNDVGATDNDRAKQAGYDDEQLLHFTTPTVVLIPGPRR
jgi:hypothetical protein